MQNTKTLKRVIACGAAGALTLAFVAIATSYDKVSSLFLSAQTGDISNYSKTTDNATHFDHQEKYPDSTIPIRHEENYKDFNHDLENNWNHTEDHRYEKNENEWNNDYLDKQNNDPNTATTNDYRELENHPKDYPDNQNERNDYNHDSMHGSATDDNKWREENDNYREYEKQNEEKREHDKQEFEQKRNDLMRELGNRTRDLRKFRRQAKNNSELSSLIDQIENKIQEIRNCANTETDSTGKCWEFFEELNPLFEKAYFAESTGYLQKELKELDRKKLEFARMEKNGIDTTNLRVKLAKIKNLLEKMLTTTDSKKREDLRYEKEELWEEFNQEMNNAFRSQEFARFDEQCNKHLKKEVERIKKELARENSANNIIAELDKLVATCKKIVAEAKAKADNNDFIDGWEISEKIREQVWERLEELTRSFHEDRKCKDIHRGAKELDHGLNVEAPNILTKIPDSMKPKLEELIKKGKIILKDIRTALNNNNCEKAARIMQDAENLHWQFKEIIKKSGLEEDLIDYEDDYKDMYEDFADADFDVNEKEFKQFMKAKRFGVNEMDQMKKLSKDVLADYIENTVDSEDNTLEFASIANLENSKLQALIQSKNELMSEVQKLRGQVSTLKQEIKNITAELGSYNFGIGTAKDEAKELANRITTLNENDAQKEFRKIKEKAISQKFEQGLIGFKDADDNAWFSGFALKAKNKGLIKGNGDGSFMNPSGNLNYSEAVVAFGRIAGIDENASSYSIISRRLAPWAMSGVVALERRGVNLDFMQNVNAGDAIRREEVAILLNDVLDLSNVAISNVNFTDLDKASARARQAIANVSLAGIMTGKGDSTEFGVGENLSRAALTKVLVIATEKNDL
jgi:hypothetical protein